MQGWIKLYRQIRECDMWLGNEPFDRRSAWIDLLLMANHEDKKVLFNANIITVKAGGFITSEVKLAERWKWSRWKVDRFLMLLVADEKIQLKKNSKMTAINIVNWAKYQVDDASNQQQNDIKPTSDQHQTSTNKNDKNDKNINTPSIISPTKPIVHERGQYGWVQLTDAEYSRLVSDLGEQEAERAIAYVDESAQSTGNKNKWRDWNLVVRKASRDGWGLNKRASPAHNLRSSNHEQRKYTLGELQNVGANLLDREDI